MTGRFAILIPARLESVRLPDKPLADLGGKPMIQRVWERAREAGGQPCAVATDSERIAAAVKAFGARAILTAPGHESGTSRLAEAVARLDLDADSVVVNLQGDEPLMPPACLRQVAGLLDSHPEAEMATLWRAFDDPAQWQSPDAVKIVVAHAGRALYFSRAPVPFSRDGQWPAPRRHLGVYAYRVSALAAWDSLPNSPLEKTERLEQLRALEAGWNIVAAEAVEPVPGGVDTPEDLARVQACFEAMDSGKPD